MGRSGQEWAGRRRRDDLMARYRLLDEELFTGMRGSEGTVATPPL